jgi:S-adenosylmethionine uptake transporter
MNHVAQRPLLAFACALSAVALLSIMDAVMKHLVIAIGIVAVSVWRAVANLAIASALYLPRRLPWPSMATVKIHALRSVVVTIMAALFFWGIGRVPLAQALALTFIAPMIALLLSALFLGEKIGGRSIAGAALAFAGVIVIVLGQARGDLGNQLLLGSAAIIGSALCYAVNIVMMRHQALIARPLEINFFQCLFVILLWLGLISAIGAPALPGTHTGWIVIASLLSTAGGLIFSFAYARAPASYLATTEYSGFLWASALGWLIFREPVSLYTVAGAGLIVTGCILAATGRLEAPPEIDVAA